MTIHSIINAAPENFGFPSGILQATSADTLQLTDRVAAKLLSRQAQAVPERIFITFNDVAISYADADRRANRAAHVLAGQGIANGARVALLLRNCPEYLDLWFGLSRLGAVQVPLNTEYKAPQIAHILRRAPVEAIVVHQELLPELLAGIASAGSPLTIFVIGNAKAREKNGIAGQCQWFDFCAEFQAASDAALASSETVSGADIAVVMNTSGTTGPSKGVLLTHAQQYILGRMIAADMALRDDDVFYNFFPLFHNTAQAMITIPVLLKGARMVLTEKFSASRFWDDVRTHHCTAFYYIGEILRILLKNPPPADCKKASLRVGWGIGASADDFAQFRDRYGTEMHTGYGSTEANVPVYLPRDAADPASCGRAAPGFEICIADSDGKPLPADETGEILVKAEEPCALMQGYDADPQATSAAWWGEWLRTGDAGRVDGAGNLYFAGRIKDAIRVRGENISAFEVEQVIAELEGVVEVAAIAVPSQLGGDDLKIVVVMAPDASLLPDAIIEHARRNLPKFSVPRYIEFTSALPKTPTNKIQKHLLRVEPFNAHTWDRDAVSMAREAL